MAAPVAASTAVPGVVVATTHFPAWTDHPQPAAASRYTSTRNPDTPINQPTMAPVREWYACWLRRIVRVMRP